MARGMPADEGILEDVDLGEKQELDRNQRQKKQGGGSAPGGKSDSQYARKQQITPGNGWIP